MTIFMALILSSVAGASVCNVNLGSHSRAERVCSAQGHALVQYVKLEFIWGSEKVELLGHGCDCGPAYLRPPGITVGNLCIRKQTSNYENCAGMECDYHDRSPWCINREH